ncbi:MAG: Na+/H+ antiporter subunit E [Corynebacterium sp.]|nr:Na+/H+ antiporter subunit E [Corynebacterium sp.]
MHWFSYIPWLIWQIILGAFGIDRDALRSQSQVDPEIIRYPLRVDSDRLITILSLSITMTPGTMTIGVEDDPNGVRYLLVHSIWHDDPQELVESIGDMEARMCPRVRELAHPALSLPLLVDDPTQGAHR